MTPLDTAHAAMQAGDDAASRGAFWGLVAAAELHLWLAAEARGDALAPQLFEIEGASYALAFDAEDRLAAFAGASALYAALPGRRLAALLSAQGLGLGLNFGAPSETLVPPADVAWLARTGAAAAESASGRPVAVAPPALPARLLEALDRRLASAEGLARRAWLARAEWADGRKGHLLAVEEAVPGAAAAIAHSVAEALAFAGESAPLDVAAVDPAAPLAERLGRVALRFDLPEPPAPPLPDPSRPPRLR